MTYYVDLHYRHLMNWFLVKDRQKMIRNDLKTVIQRSRRNDPYSWLLSKQMPKIFATLSRSHFIQFQLPIWTVYRKYTKILLEFNVGLLTIITWLLYHVVQDMQEYLYSIHNLFQYFSDLLSWNHPFDEYKSHQDWKLATSKWVLSQNKVQMLIWINEIPSRIDILNKIFYVGKVECVFLMVIWSEFRMGQYRGHDHRDEAAHFKISKIKEAFQTSSAPNSELVSN